MLTLAIPCLTTSNLPWFANLTFQVLVQYCSLQHQTLFYHQSHPQLGVVFLWLHPFILSVVISPLISSSILGTLLTWGVPLSVSYNFPFSYCSWGSQGKNPEVVCHSHLLKNFPQFVMIHTVKGFNVVNKAEVDVSLELSCFFYDPMDVGDLISERWIPQVGRCPVIY